MSTSECSEEPEREDAQLAALFGQVGSRPEPTARQLAHWRHRFSADLRRARNRRRWRAGVWLGGACAAAVALAVAMSWHTDPMDPAVPVAEVVTAFGGNVVIADGEVSRILRVGEAILEGERVQSGQRSGLGIGFHGADVRMNAGTVAVFHNGALELVTGTVYLDIAAARGPAPGTLSVDTPAGTFTHVGTQFLVRVMDGEVLGAVREGAIRLSSSGGDTRLTAGRETARALVVDQAGAVRRTDVAPAGELWAWALRSARGLVLDGRSAHEVVEWAAREQGLRLQYTGPSAERSAHQAILNDPGRQPKSPVRALEFVDSATRLDLNSAQHGVLRVTEASERDQDTH